MGDRFYLTLSCAYCCKKSSVYYAPTCESFDFKCGGCSRVNFIAADLSVKKVEDVVVDDVRQAIEMSTTSTHTDAALRRWAQTSYKALAKRAGLTDAR